MRYALAALPLATLALPLQAAELLDPEPRIAVMSAFAPEWQVLRGALEDPQDHMLHGMTFVTGSLSGQEVVVMLSGVSMVNAAMTTQMVLDHFDIEALVFSGIAGGVDPELSIGDVIVAERWGQYLDAVFARETSDGVFEMPGWMTSDFDNFGMIYTRDVSLEQIEDGGKQFWFETDPTLLEAAARAAEGLTLEDCDAEETCLPDAPQITIGGSGVSGPVFVDNADFRQHAADQWGASVLDMESAAVAQVAQVNAVPFIAFRSLSDLAGGSAEPNEMATFMDLAAGNSAALVQAFLAELD